MTVAVTVQVPLAAIEPPERLIALEPGDAVAVPPQVEVKPLGLPTTRPGGKGVGEGNAGQCGETVRVHDGKADSGWRRRKELIGDKCLADDRRSDNGQGRGVAALPGSASLLDTPVVMFVCTPGVALVTVNVTVQLAPRES